MDRSEIATILLCCVHTTCLDRKTKKNNLHDIKCKGESNGKFNTSKGPHWNVVDVFPSSKSRKTGVCD